MALVAVGACLLSCGYRSVYATSAQSMPRVSRVTVVRSLVTDAIASDQVQSGLREELLREGLLSEGGDWPRVELEVLRADESSEGVADRGGVPLARALEMAIVARAWIATEKGAPPVRDTGDMRAQDIVSVDENPAGALDPVAGAFHGADALRAAARRLGRALARRLGGHVATSE